MEDFVQEGPILKNQFEDDHLLKSYIKRKIPAEYLEEMTVDLKRLGDRTTHEILELGYQAEKEEPIHIPYSSWGERVDEIVLSHAWKRLSQIAVEEKLIAIPYERKQKSFSRVYQMLKIYLYGSSSAISTCPLAMSDGASRAIEVYGDGALKDYAFRKLTSEDPKNYWTSGQWMTEKTGGSDVGRATTIAKAEKDHYRLYGTKWFTSSVASEMAMTLARIEGSPEGGRGLSLFYLETKNKAGSQGDGPWNHIIVQRLKEKMGTEALPTAELQLDGTIAHLVGSEGDGVKKISTLFNITRIWNAISAVSIMRRGLALAYDYAEKRFVFGKFLKDHALHQETLFDLQVELETGFLLVMRVAELLGKSELEEASVEENALLRLLTPIAKLYTAKQSIQVSSEIIESFGGIGYLEDSHIPRLLREAQVLSIWEGTTNVLSLDMLRALQKDNSLEILNKDLDSKMNKITSVELLDFVQQVKKSQVVIKSFFVKANQDSEFLLKNARNIAFKIAETYMGGLLIEHAEWLFTNEKDLSGIKSCKRWGERHLEKKPFIDFDSRR